MIENQCTVFPTQSSNRVTRVVGPTVNRKSCSTCPIARTGFHPDLHVRFADVGRIVEVEMMFDFQQHDVESYTVK